MAKKIEQFKYLLVTGEDEHEETLIIDYKYYPGDPGVHTYPNGDPGYPPSDPEVDILNVSGTNRELTDKDYKAFEDAILEYKATEDYWN